MIKSSKNKCMLNNISIHTFCGRSQLVRLQRKDTLNCTNNTLCNAAEPIYSTGHCHPLDNKDDDDVYIGAINHDIGDL